ncbi:MAG: fatty acid synthase multidomain-containing protein [Marinobacter sp. T13-3]|nr:MAG: fatty acid synthase multidomain-containing protein [Marinobacter sp. T13-3]
MQKPIAVVGYSVRLPGCDNSDELWQALLDKRDLVTEVADERWSKEAWQHPNQKHPGTSCTFKAGSLGDVSGFDAAFFGLSPREVSHMDPQQRLLLEMSWEAMERACIAPSTLRGSNTGVFMGIASVDYAYRFADDFAAIDANTGTGTASSIASNRISHLFDLKGPSVSMDTACSSSMVAFHQACQSILSGETDQALTGGISLHLHPYGFMIFSKATMLSPDGRCKVFDADGNGYVRSEGGGVFLLKDYDKALADGDRILAVVAASAVNTDGHKSGLTVPSVDAQTALMRQACERAGLQPEQIDYIEAHGTGTPVGDPIETQAISQALGQGRSNPLKIGSVKSNLGHLETASGVAGLAKALLSIEHRQVPATIHLNEPNPNIPFETWNLDVVADTLELPKTGSLTIGVNSFGFGGANAHVILQTPPQAEEQTVEPANQPAQYRTLPLILSARSGEALGAMAQRTAEQIRQTPSLDLYDLCWNARYRREQHEQAMLVWAESPEQTADALEVFAAGGEPVSVFTGTHQPQTQGSVWVYSGNGCQWAGMGRRLLAESELARNTVAEINKLVKQYTDDCDLEQLLGEEQSEDCYALTELAQPALFALQVAMTRYLRAQGFQPAAVTGHSVGEVAAAWASGALTLEQATRVICLRSYYQGKTAGTGQMTAVATSAESLQALLTELQCDQVELAGINSPKGLTLAGAPEQLSQVEARLQADSIRFKRLNLNCAFHSPCMDPIEAGLKESLADLTPSEANLPFISTVTGKALNGTDLNAEYWWLNIRRPVLFESAIGQCVNQGHRTFLELGAHPVLRTYINDCVRAEECQGQIITTLARQQDSQQELERALAELLLSGATVDESRWFPVQGRVMALPTYPWQRQSYWKPESTESLGLLNRYYRHPLLGYALAQHPGCWEAQLDTGRVPWLADHVVGDAVVFPGAGFAEVTLAAAEQQLQEQGDEASVIDIEHLEILSPLLLEEAQSKVVRTRLEEADGAIQITARPHGQSREQQTDWQQHVKARWFAGSAGRLLTRTAEALPTRDPDFSRDEHLAAASHIGLDYGPAFQAISEGWIEGQTVIGRCQPSERIEQTLEGQLLHPGILDTAFQLFIPLLAGESQNSNHGYVPVQIGRMQLSRAYAGQAPAQIRVELKRRSPHSLLAEVGLFDVEGNAMAVLTDVRFKAVPLRKQQSQAITLLDMPLQPKPLPSAPSALNGEALLQVLQPLWADQSDDPVITELEPLLDTLALACLNDSLNQQPVTLAQLGDEQKQWAEHLINQGLVTEDDSGQLQVTEPPEADLRTIWELLLQEFPGAFVPIHAVGRFGLHLGEWLTHTGELPLVNEQAWRSMYQARQNTARKATIRSALEDSIAQQRAALAPGQTLDTLEISAADAEQWPEPNQKLDLAIVHLDAMCPSTVRELLQQLKNALRPDGQLIVLGQPHAFWLEHLVSNQPALIEQEGSLQPDADTWRQLLEELGFEAGEPVEDTEQPASAFLVSAKQPRKNTNRLAANETRTLIWADDQSQNIANGLQDYFPNTHLISSLEALQALLRERNEADEQPIQLILLNDTWASGSQTTATRRCAQLRDLIPVLESSETNVNCTVITAGLGDTQLKTTAQANHVGESGQRSANIVGQAAVWGFVRTLMNETAVPLQLVDLPTNEELTPLAALAEALACTLQEDEQYLTADGKRFVPRLEAVEQDQQTDTTQPQQSLTLGFDQPGQLRNLRWQPRTLPQPEEQQVVVDVKASGLNFRDVMYTLGLLSDEAIENGFSGPTLGLEFAGVVTAVGSGVTNFRPGDKVVGFGPSSFSTRVVAGGEALAHLPGDISFEAAATIPTTFFTVYYSLKHLARVQPGERVLIHGAAGGVGLAAIQVARLMGAEILATVGSPAKRDMVRLLGVEAIYDSRSHTFGEDILADTHGEGVDVVLNSLAGEAINQNFRVLRPFGRFLELGKRDFYENTAIGLRPFRNNISYFGVDSDQLMKVQPALTQTLFREMMALFERGELYALPHTTFPATQAVDAFRYMQQAKQIGKVVVNYPQLPQAQATADQNTETPQTGLTLSSDKTFLVTGGLGGFGLRTAQWLLEKGARHLALVSRRGQAEGEDAAIIKQLSEQGVTVKAYACDVSSREQLAETLGKIEQQQPSLGGVVHAAAVFADALVQNLTDKQIEQVLAAKAFGAQYLHELTGGCELELFVLFSSATTLFGNPGQANYVGANLALEALTQLRRTQGQTATCVRWGAIDDAGYLARNAQIKQALQSRMGGNALTAEKALAVLDRMLVNDQPLLGVMEFDWSALARFLPKANAARYQLIAQSHEGTEQDSNSDDLLAELLAMAPEARVERVTGELKHSLSQILMLPAEQIDPEQSLYDLGFDSLMGVELITDIEECFGVQLPAMAISESPSITKLTHKLLERIDDSSEHSDEPTLAQVAARHGVSEHEVENA